MKSLACQVAGVMLALALAGCGSGQDDNPPAANNPPLANAGQDQASGVLVGDGVVLDGSGSSDPDGNALNYAWTLASVPPDSEATLSDPLSDRPTFMADKAGTYLAQLVVNDGGTDSPVDEVSVTVVVPAPTVAIATPESQTIVSTNPVTVTGTVDDPSAAITVNGAATPNNNGGYSAAVALAEGGNTITVVATNGTGEGTASVDVLFKSQSAPVINITSPQPGFTANLVWDGFGASPSNAISVVVGGTIATVSNSGTPTVMVDGVAATVVPMGCPRDLICAWTTLASRYSFSAEINLSKGSPTIIATGSDTLGGTAQAQVSGVADYCRKGSAEPGVAAERGNRQNNRCHEIDGCNRNKFGAEGDPDTVSLRNQPMPNAVYNQVLVEFGAGYIPPIDDRNDFFVHGQSPKRTLGCNRHDTCYQTSVPPNDRDRAFSLCNAAQLEDHKAMCRKAYPAECPYTVTGPLGNTFKDPVKCPLWTNEKGVCFDIADIYYIGVSAGGRSQYDVRQNDYSLP